MMDWTNDIHLIDSLAVGAVAVVPIIVAIVQALKMTGKLPNKFAPLVSIAVGILVGFIFRHDTQNLSQTILAGVIYGLSASGLYSGIKTTAHATPSESNDMSSQGGAAAASTTTTTEKTETQTTVANEQKSEDPVK
jgi:hypothetical protein